MASAGRCSFRRGVPCRFESRFGLQVIAAFPEVVLEGD